MSETSQQEGEGFITDRFLERRPSPITRFLKRHGDKRITSIQICRTPVQSVVTKLLNILTFGKMKKTMEKLNYDEIFHLYSVLTLSDNSKYVLEKNHRVMVSEYKENTNKKKECINLNMTFRPTVKQLIERGEKGGMVYRYSAHKYNCQRFLIQLFGSNGMLHSKVREFILQDADKLLRPGIIRHLAQKATDTAGIVDTVVRGGEKPSDDIRLRGWGVRSHSGELRLRAWTL